MQIRLLFSSFTDGIFSYQIDANNINGDDDGDQTRMETIG